MGESDKWAVIVEAGKILDWQRTADVTSKTLSVPRYDMIRAARQCNGVFAAALDADAADCLMVALDSVGEKAFTIRESDIPPFGRPSQVYNADCLHDALHLQTDHHGTMMQMPWTELRILIAGVIRIEGRASNTSAILPGRSSSPEEPVSLGRVAGAMAVGAVLGGIPGAIMAASSYIPNQQRMPALPQPGRTIRRKSRPPKPKDTLVADIFTLEPTIRIRFVSNALNYDYLGDRLTPSGTINFRTFLADIERFSPNLVMTPLARRAMKGDKFRKDKFKGDRAFEDHCRYALAMMTTGRLK